MIDAIAYHQEMTMTNRKVKAALNNLTKCPFCWIRKICQGWHPGHQPSLHRQDHKDGAFWEASRIQETTNQKIIAMKICNGPKIYKSIGPEKHVTTYPMTILM